ncbi:MAG: hypothetical protein ACI81R_000621 [Bradymonadia bacterium]|jgi:hypothetical protein
MMSVRAYRDAPPYSPEALQKQVLTVALAQAALSGVDERRARVYTAELLNRGVGLSQGDEPSTGYAQLLSLYSALLLRVAGASLEAVRQEVEARPVKRLETLLDALLLRLGQQREDGGVVRVSTGMVEQVDGPERAPEAAPWNTSEAAPSPFYASSGSLPIAPHASLSWVRSQMTQDVMRFVSKPPGSFVGVAPKPLPRRRTNSRPALSLRTEAVAFEVQLGIDVEVSAAACNQLLSAGEREEAVEAFKAALDRALGVSL